MRLALGVFKLHGHKDNRALHTAYFLVSGRRQFIRPILTHYAIGIWCSTVAASRNDRF
ncbi:MAG: hypothetical protein AAGU23_03405 [Bacillota bacterium]